MNNCRIHSLQKVKSLLFGIVVVVVFTMCRKDSAVDQPVIVPETMEVEIEGTYAGVFTAVYPTMTRQGPVTVLFDSGHYVCSNASNYVPAGGQGTFEADSTAITFADPGFYTANFDWGLLLSGEYAYELTDSTLLFYRYCDSSAYYEYNLVRQ